MVQLRLVLLYYGRVIWRVLLILGCGDLFQGYELVLAYLKLVILIIELVLKGKDFVLLL